jgi:tetratricopeptide (TPR) repeat protein
MRSLFLSVMLGVFLVVNSFAQQANPNAQGITLIENENYTEAQKFFEGLIAKDPKNGAAHYYIGQIKYILEDFSGASDAYNKGLVANNKCIECQIGISKILLDNGKNLEAEKNLENLAKSNKKNASILSMIGEAFLYNKKTNAEKAVDYLTRSRDTDPKIASTWLKMGDAFKLKGDNGSAMTSYETAAVKDPKNLEAVMKQAQIWANTNELNLAVKKLEEAIALSPEYAPAHKLLYELYMRQMIKSGARDANFFNTKLKPTLQTYIRLAGNDSKAKERLVKFLAFTAKDYDGAIEEGKKLVASNPEEYTAHRWLAWSYGEKEMWEDCYQSSKNLIQEAGKKPAERQLYESDYEYYAKAALNTAKANPDREAEGFKIYEKVFQTNPSKAEEVYSNFAKKAYAEKDYTRAIPFYLKKDGIKALTANEMYNLAFAYFSTKDYANAEKYYVKYSELNPTNAYSYYMAARAANFQETGDVVTGKAKNHYSKYIEVEKDVTTDRNKKQLGSAYDYLGGLLYSQGDKPNAIMMYEKWLLIDPTNVNAQNQLNALKAGN